MMRDALEYFGQLGGEVPDVAVVGHVSRTWYADIDLMFAVFDVLRDVRLFRPKHGGKLPFDLHIEEVSRHMGLMDILVGPNDRAARMAPYERPYEMLAGCGLLLAFPPEGKKAEEADPRIVNLAYDEGLAVVSFTRTGKTTWRPA